MGKLYVFQYVKRWRAMGSDPRRGLIVAVDAEVARHVEKREYSCALVADVASGIFGQICEAVKRDGLHGVFAHYVHDRRLVCVFYTWQHLEALALGLEPCGVNELIAGEGTAGERVFTVENESQGAMLRTLAGVLAQGAGKAALAIAGVSSEKTSP